MAESAQPEKPFAARAEADARRAYDVTLAQEFVEELPGANTQGATIEEAREGLREAAQLVLEANRSLIEDELRDGEVIREPLQIPAA